MSEPENLWGLEQFEPPTDAVPKQILLDQAEVLERLTERTVFATVKTTRPGHSKFFKDGEDASGYFSHEFIVFSPSLDGYSVRVMTIFHELDIYPCVLESDRVGLNLPCRDERQLRDAIRKVLSHRDTQSMIRSFMALSKVA